MGCEVRGSMIICSRPDPGVRLMYQSPLARCTNPVAVTCNDPRAPDCRRRVCKGHVFYVPGYLGRVTCGYHTEAVV